MGIEVRPLSVLCNIRCEYCYQQPQREAKNVPRTYDLVKIKKAIEVEGGPFTLFGGEPLLMPVEDLAGLWAWGYERYGKNSVQTNGTLVSDEHIRLFRKYKVSVGISLDGPGELNDVRWHGTLDRTRESTRKSQVTLERLCREELRPGLIVTLHRGNACAERLPHLLLWLEHLIKIGLTHLRIHLLESESAEIRRTWALTDDENLVALHALLALSREHHEVSFDLFKDMRRLLVGDDRSVSCVWDGCDPYTTAAVRGIEGQGQRSNCGRTNKDGIDFVKGNRVGFERYLALYQTPQDTGGCQGCRFFLMCKGQCPGTAIDGDWRNRTEHCEVWKELFSYLEVELTESGIEPLSLSPKRREVEKLALEAWYRGKRVSLLKLLEGSVAA